METILKGKTFDRCGADNVWKWRPLVGGCADRVGDVRPAEAPIFLRRERERKKKKIATTDVHSCTIIEPLLLIAVYCNALVATHHSSSFSGKNKPLSSDTTVHYDLK